MTKRDKTKRRLFHKISPAGWAAIGVIVTALSASPVLIKVIDNFTDVSIQSTQTVVATNTAILKIQVRDKVTGENIENAKVTIQAGVKPSLSTGTDSEGIARFYIDKSLIGQPGNLEIDATGYDLYRIEIDVEEQATQIILLEQKP